jgi:putative endonuclease
VFYVYLLASRKQGTLYLGVTRDLVRRVYQHREKLTPGFTSRYDVRRLVWFEVYDDPINAITREKEIKKWRRAWKIALIEKDDPDWRDLYRGNHEIAPFRHSVMRAKRADPESRKSAVMLDSGFARKTRAPE